MNLIASPAQSSIYRGLERFWKIENHLKIKFFRKKRKIDWKLVKKHITRYLRLRRDRLDQNNNAPSFFSAGWFPVIILQKKFAFTSYSAPQASKCLKIGIWKAVYVFFRCCKLKFLPGLGKLDLITALLIPLPHKGDSFSYCHSDEVRYMPLLVNIILLYPFFTIQGIFLPNSLTLQHDCWWN